MKFHDLRLMDMDGNVVKVLKGMGGGGIVCTSVDHLICVTGGSSGGARVLDPATGKTLMASSEVEVRSHDEYPYIVTPYFKTFLLGRPAGQSSPYKVVRLGLSDGDGACEVLTLGDGARWRKADPPPAVIPRNRGYPVCVNGVLHFLVGKKLQEDSLLCFDLESEQWKKQLLEGPRKLVDDEEWKKTSLVRITELNGDLCMIHSLLSMTLHPRCNIWILLTDPNAGTWIKVYTIPMAYSACLYTPLVVRDDGKLLLHCDNGWADFTKSLMLQLYDPCTGACSDVMEIPKNIISRIGVCTWRLDSSV